MSRIQTQDDRLVRGPSGLRTQVGLQPQRIAPAQTSRVSELIQGLAQAGGAVIGVQEQQKAKREEAQAQQRQELYNTTVSRLTTLEDRLNHDPEFDKNDYLREYQSAINVFGEESDEGVQLRRQFMSNPEVEAFSRKREALQLEAMQGAYVRSADRQVVQYNTQEEIARLSQFEAPQATQIVFEEMLSAYSDDDLEVMTPETRDSIYQHAQAAVAFSRTAHKDRVDLNERNVNDAAYRSLLSRQMQAESYTLQDVVDFAEASQTPTSGAIDKFITDASARVETVMAVGNTEEIRKETRKLQELEASLSLFPEQQKLVTQELDAVYSKYAEDIGVVYTSMGLESFADLQTTEQAEFQMDQSGLATFEEITGRDLPDTVRRIEDIVTLNNVEQTFKEGLVKAKGNALGEFTERETKLETANRVVFDPNNASRAETRDLIDLAPPEREAFLEQRIEILLGAQTEGPANREISEAIDLLQQAKTDSGAWSNVMGRLFAESINFGVARDKILADNLDINNLSDAGVRNAIEFLGSDVDLATMTLTDDAQIYALNKTMADAAADPNLDLSGTYRTHYDFYSNIKFDAGGSTDVSLGSVFNTTKFSEKFLDQDGVVLSSNAANTLITILDASTMTEDPLSDAGLRAIHERVSDRGYHVVVQQVGEGVGVAQIVNHASIPEKVFDDMKLFNNGINTPGTQITRLLGNMIRPNQNQSIFRIGLEVAQADTSTLPEELAGIAEAELYQLMERGSIAFSVDSANATSTGAPVVMTYLDKEGQSPRKYTLGTVNFGSPFYESQSSGNYFRNLPPSYFKRPPPTLRESAENLRVRINNALRGTKDGLNSIRDDVSRSTSEPLRRGYQREADNINAALGQ